MPVAEIPFPLLGQSTNWAYEKQRKFTTPYLLNVRPYDADGKRARGGSRPGLGKAFAQQIGGANELIDAVVSVTVSGTTGDTDFDTILVAVGNGEVWYETGGAMAEITAANGDIGTEIPTAVIPAFQKVYFAQRTRFRVLDLVNVRLHTDDIAPAALRAPTRGEVLDGAGSGASMIVDYINVTDGEAYVYGYQTSLPDFTGGEIVRVDAGAEVQFTLTADEAPVDPPHWYGWTVYGQDADTYGVMPSHANIGCLYRGCIALSGNEDEPNQWYMCRQGNPYDWLYAQLDAQSPVRGGNAEAGKCPGIVTALIPYSDDYLVMGADHQVWMMRGHPAAGGVIDNLISSDGIFGPYAWTFDGSGNLYYGGTSGIYRVPISDRFGIGKPVNISNVRLPGMFDDISRTNHRLILQYDPVREGMNIFVTRITNGKGSHWWYDVRTKALDPLEIGGFFPESYLIDMGPYCTCFYDAELATRQRVILGCRDGYLRCFEDDRAHDKTGQDVDQAITSYVLLSPMNLTGA